MEVLGVHCALFALPAAFRTTHELRLRRPPAVASPEVLTTCATPLGGLSACDGGRVCCCVAEVLEARSAQKHRVHDDARPVTSVELRDLPR
ncbi:uncharacterized protein K489DRAFT_383498 [Dissoconium aciculare CBS 342.82]|uniref:Uncharacterized protein n=1 Tax=Dissoconium aciculare CBS 342.82 TaxID=1314786 RepID=A0A6J3LZ80_9PEZI|nr:uncharacterized protein K489DRAFT_383498 [Dissoconium aciculare CBS 342.82]KAF1819942.1 hypothetical protein K489DRAFT_383498 [Dissoconium aciculare CBS 342.82]